MARSQVPKFGNWEAEEIPYTICFDNATRKGKTSTSIDQHNTEVDCNDRKSSEPKSEALKSPETHKPKHQEEEMKKHIGGRNSSNSPRHLHNIRSADHSPLHPRVGGKNSNVSSPSWERKATLEGNNGLAPSTPGRSRLRSVTRADESPDRGPAVPKFGDWDETDPSSAEGYTQIFNRVREEKHSDTGKVPVMSTEASVASGHKQYGKDSTKGCRCFPWARR